MSPRRKSPQEKASRYLVHQVGKMRVEFLGAEIGAKGAIRIPKTTMAEIETKLRHRRRFLLEGTSIIGTSQYAHESPDGKLGLYGFDRADLARTAQGYIDYWDTDGLRAENFDSFLPLLLMELEIDPHATPAGQPWIAYLGVPSRQARPDRRHDGAVREHRAGPLLLSLTELRSLADLDPLAAPLPNDPPENNDELDGDRPAGTVEVHVGAESRGGTRTHSRDTERGTRSGDDPRGPTPPEGAAGRRGDDSSGSFQQMVEAGGDEELPGYLGEDLVDEDGRFDPDLMDADRGADPVSRLPGSGSCGFGEWPPDGARAGGYGDGLPEGVQPDGSSPARSAGSREPQGTPLDRLRTRTVYLGHALHQGVTTIGRLPVDGLRDPTVGEPRIVRRTEHRHEGLIVGLIADEIWAADAAGIDVLIMRLTDDFLPKSLLQRTRAFRATVLFGRVLDLHRLAGASGVHVLVVGPCVMPDGLVELLRGR